MAKIIVSPEIEAKIGADDHDNVTVKEVTECFSNHCGGYATDGRPQHLDASGKPSPWFVGQTNHGRKLKIMFVREHGNIYLKSAYPATEAVERLYAKYTR